MQSQLPLCRFGQRLDSKKDQSAPPGADNEWKVSLSRQPTLTIRAVITYSQTVKRSKLPEKVSEEQRKLNAEVGRHFYGSLSPRLAIQIERRPNHSQSETVRRFARLPFDTRLLWSTRAVCSGCCDTTIKAARL